jgi:hypothetical protein
MWSSSTTYRLATHAAAWLACSLVRTVIALQFYSFHVKSTHRVLFSFLLSLVSVTLVYELPHVRKILWMYLKFQVTAIFGWHIIINVVRKLLTEERGTLTKAYFTAYKTVFKMIKHATALAPNNCSMPLNTFLGLKFS